MRTNIKFVKRANQWCLTIFDEDAKKDKQKQEWFSTKEEAEESLKKYHEEKNHNN